MRALAIQTGRAGNIDRFILHVVRWLFIFRVCVTLFEQIEHLEEVVVADGAGQLLLNCVSAVHSYFVFVLNSLWI